MIKLTGIITVRNKKGWHARPCSRIVRLSKLHPEVTIFFEKLDCLSEHALGNSIFELMKLGVNYGDKIGYTLQGENESEVRNLLKEITDLNDLLVKEEDI